MNTLNRRTLNFMLIFIMILSTLIQVYAADRTDLKSISINGGKTLSLSVNDFYTLSVTTSPDDYDLEGLTFKSSDERIATVDYDGNVSAKREGSVTITANLNGVKSSVIVKVSNQTKALDATFTVSNAAGKANFKQITITPSRYRNGEKVVDQPDDEYYIYLPSGYLVQAKTASYVADRDGTYPFTVYDYLGNKRTFLYTIKGIDPKKDQTNQTTSNKTSDVTVNPKLLYDYEKKQILFNVELNKTANITTPDNKVQYSTDVNYYIKAMKNNQAYDFSIIVDEITYDYKIIKQGNFYLLISFSSKDLDKYNNISTYYGYNFTELGSYTVTPPLDFVSDGESYEVLVESSLGTKELFVYNVSDIDTVRPFVKTSVSDDDVIELKIIDNYALDYMITFDGKYVPITTAKANEEYVYKHPAKVDYKGNYVFTVVDKAGNRTVFTTYISSGVKPRKGELNYDVHNYKGISFLFDDIGEVYIEQDEDQKIYSNVLPAYMKGKTDYSFMPDAPISRAEIVTIFCRITDLPYDTTTYLKSKFTDISDHWARDYIAMGSGKKYVSGYKDKTFKPDASVTRAEFSQMLCNISVFKTKLSSIPATSNYNFADINGHWAKAEIIKISGRDIILGKDGSFYPDMPVTRGEVVHAINKLFGFNPSADEVNYIDSMYKKYYNFSDIVNHLYYNDIIISVVGMYREILN